MTKLAFLNKHRDLINKMILYFTSLLGFMMLVVLVSFLSRHSVSEKQILYFGFLSIIVLFILIYMKLNEMIRLLKKDEDK